MSPIKKKNVQLSIKSEKEKEPKRFRHSKHSVRKGTKMR